MGNGVIDIRDDFRGQMALSSNIGGNLGMVFYGIKKGIAERKVAAIVNRPDFDPETAYKEVQQIPMYAQTEAYNQIAYAYKAKIKARMDEEKFRREQFEKPVKVDYYDQQGNMQSQMIPQGQYNAFAQGLALKGYRLNEPEKPSNLEFKDIPDNAGGTKTVAINPKTGAIEQEYGQTPAKPPKINTKLVDIVENGVVKKALINSETGETIKSYDKPQDDKTDLVSIQDENGNSKVVLFDKATGKVIKDMGIDPDDARQAEKDKNLAAEKAQKEIKATQKQTIAEEKSKQRRLAEVVNSIGALQDRQNINQIPLTPQEQDYLNRLTEEYRTLTAETQEKPQEKPQTPQKTVESKQDWKYTAINPKTGERIGSMDGQKWQKI